MDREFWGSILDEAYGPEALRMYEDEEYGSIKAPEHPWLASAVDAYRGLGQRLEGSPMSILYDEGLADYGSKMAYGEQPDNWDRVSAAGVLGDLLPGGAALGGALSVVGGPARRLKYTRRAGDVYDTKVLDRRNDGGYSTNPLMAEVDPDVRPSNIAKGSYKGKLDEYQNNPRIRAREDARLGGNRAVATEDLKAMPATYEDMLGNKLIQLPADRTGVFDITRIAGRDLDEPIQSLGGPLHADKFGDWRSMEKAAQAKQRHANAVGAIDGNMPIYMYMSMDHPGSNFSHMASEGALKYIDAGGGLDSSGILALDSKMRSLPDTGDFRGIAEAWPGYESPEQMMHWLLDDPTGMSGGPPSLGNRRKAFMGALNLKDIQDAGGVIPNDLYSAINEPALRDQPVGFSGFRGLLSREMDPDNLIHEPGVHKSYDTVISGDKTFAFDEPMVPYDVMFPDMANARLTKKPPQRMRSVQTAGSQAAANYQDANEEWLQGIYDWIRANPSQ